MQMFVVQQGLYSGIHTPYIQGNHTYTAIRQTWPVFFGVLFLNHENLEMIMSNVNTVLKDCRQATQDCF